MKYKCNIKIIVDDIDLILHRLYEATSSTSIEGLSEILNIPIFTIKNALRHKYIPLSWLTALHDKKGISPIWVLYGEGKICASTVYFDGASLYTAWVGY